MSVIFSRQCEYALQAVLYITANGPDRFVDIKEISGKLNIPHHFLAKILQNLSKNGLLKSQKGPSGGFTLGAKPEEISLYNIVEAVDGDGFVTECVLGLPTCGGDNPCPLHDQWGELREQIYTMLAGKTIGQLVEDIHAKPSISKEMHFA